MSLSSTDPNQNATTALFLDRYSPNLSVDNIVSQGVKVKDNNGRMVGVATGTLREQMFHTGAPYAEVMVLGTPTMLLGWVHEDKFIDAGDRFLVPVQSLIPLPAKFDFAQPCPHLSVYGGFYDSDRDVWICGSCGTALVSPTG